MEFLIRARDDGHHVKELDNLTPLECWEMDAWHMAVNVYKEINSGMGQGLMMALVTYCEIYGIDEETRLWFHKIASKCMPERKKTQHDGSKSVKRK